MTQTQETALLDRLTELEERTSTLADQANLRQRLMNDLWSQVEHLETRVDKLLRRDD